MIALAGAAAPMMTNGLAQEGLRSLRAKFTTVDDVGPAGAAKVAKDTGANEEFAK